MKRILITGGAGFIGSNLAEKLLKTGRYEISILDIKNNPTNLEKIREKINYINGDIRKENLLDGVLKTGGFDGVIHLAAVSRVVWGENEPERCESTNIGGTNLLMQSISHLKDKPWVIFGSSREVYGEQSTLPVKESARKMPINIYGKTKLEGEKIVIQQSKNFNINAIILRFSNVYGNERDILDRVIPKFIIKALQGEPLEIQGGHQIFDFTHVDDTVRGIISAMKHLSKKENGTLLEDFHILTGNPTKIIDLPYLISKYTETHVKIKFTNPRDYDVGKFYGDPSKAKNLLGFAAKISIDEGIKTSVKRFMEAFA